MQKILIAWAVLFALCSPAAAQQLVKPCTTTSSTSCPPVASSAPLPINGATAIPTFAAGSVAYSQSSASDLMCINGSSTKTIYVKKIRVSAVASAAVTQDVSVVKRSTADTCSVGCTPTALTTVPLDSNNSSATATVTAYSSSSGWVAGTTVGTIRSQKHAIGTASSTAIGPSPVLFDFYSHYDQPAILHGTAEGICVLVGSTAGGSWDFDVEWIEQ